MPNTSYIMYWALAICEILKFYKEILHKEVLLSAKIQPRQNNQKISSKKLRLIFFGPGSHLSSHTVASIVLSAVLVLTVVFGMGTGVSPKRIATGNFLMPLASKQ